MGTPAYGNAEAGYRGSHEYHRVTEPWPACSCNSRQLRALEPATPTQPRLLRAGIDIVEERKVRQRR
jgi:hypothetical protein